VQLVAREDLAVGLLHAAELAADAAQRHGGGAGVDAAARRLSRRCGRGWPSVRPWARPRLPGARRPPSVRRGSPPGMNHVSEPCATPQARRLSAATRTRAALFGRWRSRTHERRAGHRRARARVSDEARTRRSTKTCCARRRRSSRRASSGRPSGPCPSRTASCARGSGTP
jgi:hypothetical protein